MAAKLINGNGFRGVSAQIDADFYEGLFGNDTSVLAVGRRMEAEIVDNSPRIYDGVILTKEGRRIQIDYGTYEDFTIPEGIAGVTSYYIIGFRLVTGADDSQTCQPFVRAVNSPTATIEEVMLKDGNAEVYVSVYRVTQVGQTNTLGDRLLPEAINSMMNIVYPVGSIYMSVSNVSPATLFGGTWEQISGKFLLSADSSHAAGTTGGAASHTLTAAELPAHAHSLNNHTHTVPAHTHSASTASSGAHTHSIPRWQQATPTADGTGRLAQGSIDSSYITSKAGAHTHSVTVASKPAFNTAAASGSTGNTGGGTAISLMPPYLAVYMWKRTA